MNNKFNWNRFCKVVNKDFRNIWHTFGPTMLILAVLPFALWLFILVLKQGDHISMPSDIRLIMIEGLAYLAALMAPSRMYRTWNLTNEGIYYAMLPASKLEKFCSALLYSIVICPLAVYLGGMALDVFLTALPFGPWQSWLWEGKMGFPFTVDLSALSGLSAGEPGSNMFMHFGSLWVIGCWVGYIGTVLMFVFTSTIFKRHKVLQTILWLYVIEFVISIILIPVFLAVFTNTNFMEWIYDTFYGVDPTVAFNWLFWGTIVFDVLLAGIFGWLSWRRLKRMAY